ncbi:MAG TPA: FkbM family methyltransferase [Candidatus Nanoarchaeia archaeon]|nr:FkbM family methyltransferase [Candidatus Nanoarchaeia archaeon]
MNLIRAVKHTINGDLYENLDMIFPWKFRKIVRRFLYKNYSSMLTKDKIKKLLKKENPIILEIGANNGRDTREFLFTFKNCSIYCFEPDLRAIRKFKDRVQDRRCKLFEVAVGDHDGFATFYISAGWGMKGGWDGASSIKKPKEVLKLGLTFEKKMEVKTLKLDTWVKENNIEKIDFIWADVQGAERDLIVGGIKTLNDKTKYLYTEFSDEELYEG